MQKRICITNLQHSNAFLHSDLMKNPAPFAGFNAFSLTSWQCFNFLDHHVEDKTANGGKNNITKCRWVITNATETERRRTFHIRSTSNARRTRPARTASRMIHHRTLGWTSSALSSTAVTTCNHESRLSHSVKRCRLSVTCLSIYHSRHAVARMGE